MMYNLLILTVLNSYIHKCYCVFLPPNIKENTVFYHCVSNIIQEVLTIMLFLVNRYLLFITVNEPFSIDIQFS